MSVQFPRSFLSYTGCLRLTDLIQRNVTTRDGLVEAFRRNKTHQHTVSIRASRALLFGTGWRVFEDQWSPPNERCAVAALLHKLQLTS